MNMFAVVPVVSINARDQPHRYLLKGEFQNPLISELNGCIYPLSGLI